MMRNDINSFKDDIVNEHVHFKIDFSNKHDKFLIDINKHQEQLSINSTRISNHMEVLKNHEAIIETYRKNLSELYETIGDLNEKKMSKFNYEAELLQIRRDLLNMKCLN